MGVGWRGQNIKSQKWLIFANFVLIRGYVRAGPPMGKDQMAPMSPHVTTAFFPEKYQTLHELSLANCMHGNEMIIVDS